MTWQPRAGLRLAAVIATYRAPSGSGSVVAARSLHLVEERETAVGQIVGAGWLAALLATALAAFAGAMLIRPRRD